MNTDKPKNDEADPKESGPITRSKSQMSKEKSSVEFNLDEDSAEQTDAVGDEITVEDEELVDDKALDSLGAFYLKIGHNDAMIFDEVNTCFKTDLEPISMYVVEIPKSQHNRPDVEEAKKVELNNLMTYETF